MTEKLFPRRNGGVVRADHFCLSTERGSLWNKTKFSKKRSGSWREIGTCDLRGGTQRAGEWGSGLDT